MLNLLLPPAGCASSILRLLLVHDQMLPCSGNLDVQIELLGDISFVAAPEPPVDRDFGVRHEDERRPASIENTIKRGGQGLCNHATDVQMLGIGEAAEVR